MKPGLILRKFVALDGREVTLRTPMWQDLEDMLDFINGLVDEEAMILMNSRQTYESEVDWLAKKNVDLEKGKHVSVVAEVEGRMVGSCEITPRPGRMSHVGSLGISVSEGYRDIGIGQALMKEVERQAVHLGVRTIILEVFAINDRAIHVYEKMGYNKTGIVPDAIKYKGEYVDSVNMYKKLST